MNISEFNRRISRIEVGIERAHVSLETEEADAKFPNALRKQFNISLINLISLLNKDSDVPGFAWHLAHRIVKFHKIYIKINKIRAMIFIQYPATPYFVNKIKTASSRLKGRIDALSLNIYQNYRLPFSVGTPRDKFHHFVKRELLMEEAYSTSLAQKEYFHLLGDHFNHAELRGIKVEEYNGSNDIHSYESWSQVLRLMINEGSLGEKEIGERLLKIIQNSISHALKFSYVGFVPQMMRLQNNELELEYFEDLSIAAKARDFHDFHNKYSLDNFCSIPRNVLINEIVWDILDTIGSLQADQHAIFPMGTYDHAILVQVTCLVPASESCRGNYQYIIFNTGNGVDRHHKLDRLKKHAYPLVFTDLPREAFSYSFFATLVSLAYTSVNINLFYKLHNEVFIERFGGKKEMSQGKLYFLQKWGTCSYAAVEAWIESFLTAEQSDSFKLYKIKMAVGKQKDVSNINRTVRNHYGRWKVKKKNQIAATPISASLDRMAIETDRLFELGIQRLQELNGTL